MKATTRLAATLAATLLLIVSPGQAQDVELLARVYGTQVPQAYYARAQANPRLFRFQRGFRGLLPAVRAPQAAPPPGIEGIVALAPGGAAPVRGAVRIPLILARYSDSGAPPVTAAEIERDFFKGPNGYYRTLSEYYGEVSGSALTLSGDVYDWVTVPLTQAVVVGRDRGLGNDARVGEYVIRTLRFLTDSLRVDWRKYDADADGWVDVVAVMHPDRDGACGGPGLWSHHSSLSEHLGGPFLTTLERGDTIRIDDFVVAPAVTCNLGREIAGTVRTVNEIGVLAHELGHAFGLPDLYSTSNARPHGGVGSWDLMATGSWGCSYTAVMDPARPCHMGAWSKEQLGWARVDTRAGGLDHGMLRLDPIETGGSMLRVPSGDGSSDYFLLENRQRLGFDEQLFAPGVLIWHIDPDVVAARSGSNTLNVDPQRMGVALEQADGRNQLTTARTTAVAACVPLAPPCGNYGDSGDPFPGSAENTAFHAATRPSSASHLGRVSGVTLVDLAFAGETAELRVSTRFPALRLVAQGTSAPATMTVGGSVLAVAPTVELRLAPFETRTVEAAPGALHSPGDRDGFVAWEDGGPRVRSFTMGLADTTLAARYGGREYLLDIKLESPVPGIDPGRLVLSPQGKDGWFPANTEVTASVTPVKGFAFLGWSGALAGAPNPVSLRMEGPRSAAGRFQLLFAVTTVTPVAPFDAATAQEIVFRAESGSEPVYWSHVSGRLPEGLALGIDGRITGAALETGSFVVTVRATDAIGLEATANLALEVRIPRIPALVLASPFLLAGEGPTALQQLYLDRQGNRGGFYDLGDLRAYLVANPSLPQAVVATYGRAAPIVVPLVDFREGRARERR